MESMDDLEQRKDFRVVIAGGQNQDQDGVGVKPWRVAMYAASSTPVGALEFGILVLGYIDCESLLFSLVWKMVNTCTVSMKPFEKSRHVHELLSWYLEISYGELILLEGKLL